MSDLELAEAAEFRSWVDQRNDSELLEWLHRVTEQQIELAFLKRAMTLAREP